MSRLREPHAAPARLLRRDHHQIELGDTILRVASVENQMALDRRAFVRDRAPSRPPASLASAGEYGSTNSLYVGSVMYPTDKFGVPW